MGLVLYKGRPERTENGRYSRPFSTVKLTRPFLNLNIEFPGFGEVVILIDGLFVIFLDLDCETAAFDCNDCLDGLSGINRKILRISHVKYFVIHGKFPAVSPPAAIKPRAAGGKRYHKQRDNEHSHSR